MYSYTFKIYFIGINSHFMEVKLNAKNRFSFYEDITIKSYESGEAILNSSISSLCQKKECLDSLFFFEWLAGQTVWGHPARLHRSFSPFEFFSAVKQSDLYDISVETNEPVEDFGDPGTYFKDRYDPDVDY